MHEDSKIREAEHFLCEISTATAQPDKTRFCASAFLSAARSALQYALKEAKTRPGGQAWYDGAVAGDPVVAFLKDHRDINIHDRPAPMRTNVFIQVPSGHLSFSSSTSDWIPASAIGTTTYSYHFKGWAGSEDVGDLCCRYLSEIKRIVADGRSKGFLTPPQP